MLLSLAVALLAAPVSAAPAGPRIHVARAGLANRIALAASRVANESCGPAVLAHFGTAVPDAQGIANKLDALTFEDGAEQPACKAGAAAFAHVNGNTVWICPGFDRVDSRTADALLVHEILHTLGLRESPPSSREITAEVLRRCR